MSEKRNVPKLRFDGFTEKWKKESIENHIEFLSGYPFKGDDISEDKSGTPLLRGVNIGEGLIRHTAEIDKYFLGNTKKLQKYYLEVDDLVIGMDGSKVGKNSALISEKDSNSILIQRVARLRALGDNSIKFIFQHINSETFVKYVDSVKTSSGIPHISSKQINKFEIYFPEFREQQKIASFLTSVDRRIELLQQKKEKLERYKKGVMQQLFTRKIRFKADDGSEFPDWEEKKLGVLGRFSGGGTPISSNEDFWAGSIPWISSSDISEDSIFKISKTRFISESAISNSATKLIPPKSILIVTRVGVGKVAYCEEGVCTSQDFTNLSPVDDVKPIFLAYSLFFHSSKIKSMSQGTSIKGVTVEEVKNLKIPVPVVEEQLKIENFLRSIDLRLEQLISQIQQSQTWKKGLLQQMFV